MPLAADQHCRDEVAIRSKSVRRQPPGKPPGRWWPKMTENSAKQLGRYSIDRYGDGVVSTSSQLQHSQPSVSFQGCELWITIQSTRAWQISTDLSGAYNFIPIGSHQ